MNQRHRTILITVAIAAAAALTMLAWPEGSHGPEANMPAASIEGDAEMSVGALEKRLHSLESALEAERQARQWLEEEILFLGSELERLSMQDGTDRQAAAEPDPGPSEVPVERTSPRMRGVARDLARLVNAGFTQAEAEWILHRESELQMQALRERYEAERLGEAPDYFSGRDAAGDELRAELGDEAYERYLGANRRSISVTVGSVLESSPAQAAGLAAGDEIVSYGGRRVFDLSDLTTLTKEGEPGQVVVVDILRGGQPMQVVIPRGPLGITGGRRYAR